MGCCGQPSQVDLSPSNTPQPGDILVQAQWHGNTRQVGRATGRIYERTAYPKTLYVNEADVNAAPQHWKRITEQAQASTGVVLQPAYAPAPANWQDSMQDVVNAMMPPAPDAPSQPVVYKPNITGRKKADVLNALKEDVK